MNTAIMVDNTLALKEKHLFALLNSSDDVILSVDRDYRLISMNEAVVGCNFFRDGVFLGVGDELMGCFRDFEREQWRVFFGLAFEGNKFTVEERYRTTTSTRYFEITFNPVCDMDGAVIGASFFAHNVTKRKTIEAKILHSEANLQDAQRVARLGSYDMPFDTLIPVWSETMYEMLGVRQTDPITHETYNKLTHPDDRESTRHAFKEAMRSGIQGRVEHRILRKDGKLLYVAATSNVVKDKAGELIKVYGTVQDITERKLNELEMERIGKELTELNATLEKRVKARTAELESAMAQLEITQKQLLQSEKLASLGQLLAGVAHEINSPLGAVQASAGTIQEIMPNIVEALPNFMKLLKGDELLMFKELLNLAMYGQKAKSSKEEREVRKLIHKQLEGAGFEDADEMARTIVQVALIGNINPYIELFKGVNKTLVLDLLFQLAQFKVNLDNIVLAVEKTRKTVSALKSYSYATNAEHQWVNLNDNINLILTLYHNQMKYGIDLSTHFEEELLVFCNPD